MVFNATFNNISVSTGSCKSNYHTIMTTTAPKAIALGIDINFWTNLSPSDKYGNS